MRSVYGALFAMLVVHRLIAEGLKINMKVGNLMAYNSDEIKAT